MFEAKISEASVLSDSIKAIYELIKEEVSFKLTNDGMSLRAMDPANVAMVSFRLLVPAFEAYKLEGDMTLGVDMERLYNVLKQALPGDAVVLKADETKLHITYEGRSKRRFSIPLLELNNEDRKAPNLEFSTTARITPNAMKQALSDAKVVGDSVVFNAADDVLKISATGDTGEVEVELKADNEQLLALEVREASRARYALDYLEKMIKGSKLSNEVIVKFKTDYPIEIDYALKDTLMLSFILAPRVETD